MLASDLPSHAVAKQYSLADTNSVKVASQTRDSRRRRGLWIFVASGGTNVNVFFGSGSGASATKRSLYVKAEALWVDPILFQGDVHIQIPSGTATVDVTEFF